MQRSPREGEWYDRSISHRRPIDNLLERAAPTMQCIKIKIRVYLEIFTAIPMVLSQFFGSRRGICTNPPTIEQMTTKAGPRLERLPARCPSLILPKNNNNNKIQFQTCIYIYTSLSKNSAANFSKSKSLPVFIFLLSPAGREPSQITQLKHYIYTV